MLCRVAAVKHLSIHHHSAGYILLPLGSLSPSFFFQNRISLKPALRGVCSLANYSVACEVIQSNRVSDFRDFVCSSFPNAIFFYFYFPCYFSIKRRNINHLFVTVLSSWGPLPTSSCLSSSGHYTPLCEISKILGTIFHLRVTVLSFLGPLSEFPDCSIIFGTLTGIFVFVL